MFANEILIKTEILSNEPKLTCLTLFSALLIENISNKT